MEALASILVSTFAISLIAFIGVITLALREKLLDKIVILLVAFSAGALIGAAFLHIIPEALEIYAQGKIFLFCLVGFSSFFLVEKIFHWRHCHKGNCEVHTFAHMNLFGDAVHNFIDGIIIAASFVVNPAIGISTTMAIAMHEIPQNIGNYGVLIYAKFGKLKALLLNFSVALTVILGGIVGFFFASYAGMSTSFLLPFAAGGFIYIAASDLVPEIRKQAGLAMSALNFIVFILGIAVIYAL